MKRKPYEKALIFRVCELFLERGMKVSEIADTVNSEFKGSSISRESIYPILSKGKDLGILRLVPPVEKSLAKELSDKFDSVAKKDITVVNAPGSHAYQHIAYRAAELVLSLIRKLAEGGRTPVTLGLGPGFTTLHFSRHLSRLLESETGIPKLKLFSITAGAPHAAPHLAPVSFFNLFPRSLVECVGLFAETMVPASEYSQIINRPGIKEVLARKDEIDIVVTAMGDFADEDDQLRKYLVSTGVDIDNSEYLGNVQYRAYSAKQPILEQNDQMRAVTLFELDEFKDMASRKGKHVVLLAGSCGLCGNTHTSALLPLLENPNLKVWSELIVDVEVSQALLASKPKAGKDRG